MFLSGYERGVGGVGRGCGWENFLVRMGCIDVIFKGYGES